MYGVPTTASYAFEYAAGIFYKFLIEVIGKTHPHTEAALHLLEEIGVKKTRSIDIIDAGPNLEAATKEIKKTDTVTAKLPDSSKSPQTGDNSNLILWIALLFISGGVMKGVTAFDKLKKYSAKIKDK